MDPDAQLTWMHAASCTLLLLVVLNFDRWVKSTPLLDIYIIVANTFGAPI